MFFNRSETFWGPDSRQFNPERWLNDLTYPAKDLHGYRHLYTFADGQRMCLGRGFALAELKVSLFFFFTLEYMLNHMAGFTFGSRSEFLVRVG